MSIGDSFFVFSFFFFHLQEVI